MSLADNGRAAIDQGTSESDSLARNRLAEDPSGSISPQAGCSDHPRSGLLPVRESRRPASADSDDNDSQRWEAREEARWQAERADRRAELQAAEDRADRRATIQAEALACCRKQTPLPWHAAQNVVCHSDGGDWPWPGRRRARGSERQARARARGT
jgi:hypothetical protein